MPFVSRKKDGTIYGVYGVCQFKNQEFLLDDSPEVIEFRTEPANTDEALIQEKITKMQREAAITKLKEEGKLPTDFESQQSTKEI